MSKKDWAAASRSVASINFGPAIQGLRNRLEFLALNGAIFGASQFVPEKEGRETYLVQDREIPPWIHTQVHQTLAALDGAQNDTFRRRLQDLLSEAELDDPSSPFRSTDSIQLFKGPFDLADALTRAVDSGVKLQSSISANLMTSRMAAIGALSQANKLQITKYQWNAELDRKTCPFCRGMHGKIFQVVPTLNRLMSIVMSQDPETARRLSPWAGSSKPTLKRLAGLSETKLQEEGFAQPPAHPRCRCILSLIGTVPIAQIHGFQIPRETIKPAELISQFGAAFAPEEFSDGS